MTENTARLYDDVPYPSFPLEQTHPDRLATIATLLGLEPAPVDRCKVLELGCGDGNNLIPMALALPQSTFVGVDLALQPTLRGQAIARDLGLANLSLEQRDVCDLTPEFGTFDYVIAHGLYTWVPAAVRDRVLAICRANLAPQGVAYISYNTLPGCHARRMIREMLQFHVRNLAEPREKIEQAVAFLQFLREGQIRPDWFTAFLQSEFEDVGTREMAHLLFHDDLAEINEPVYLHQFVRHAAQHGLQFLAEADYYEMQDTMYPPAISGVLQQMARRDVVLKEQYLDFLKARRFRQTLLCHANLPLTRPPAAQTMIRLAITSAAEAVSSTPDLQSRALEEFRGPRGAALKTDHPLSKAALVHLRSIWPRSERFADLVAAARGRLGAAPHDSDIAALAGLLLGAYSAGLVDLHLYPPHLVTQVGDRPRASALARRQAAACEILVTSLRHTPVAVDDPLERDVLARLDGARDRQQLAEEVHCDVPRLNAILEHLARQGLLEA